MRNVIGIGETVLDIIFKNDQPVAAVPGGSTFNGIISLGRAGINVSFISETGNDRVGERIVNFLKKNHVNADNINIYPESKSPLSLAFLDDNNDAEYIFYKDHPHDRLDFVYPDVHPNDIVMFGSYYAINPVIRPQVVAFLDYARNHGAIIYYDVNFRSSHNNELMKLTSNILENFEYADIIRGSIDDFRNMYNVEDTDKIYRGEIEFYCHQFICTNGAKNVEVRSDRVKKSYPVPNTRTVSTIGAGDNFNAGFIYGLIKNNVTKDIIDNGMDEALWNNVIECAQRFSDNACQSINNYISDDFGKMMADELNK
jgi:fructokinase